MPADEMQIHSFLQSYFSSNEFKIFPLAGDASSRRYFRIVADQKSWVLMSWETFVPEDYPFLSVRNHFENCGIRVPAVETLDAQLGLILLEDLGDLTLERKFWESQSQLNSLIFYRMAIDEMIKIHFQATERKSSICTAFKIKFDTEKFLWEMNYGKDNLFTGVLNIKLSEKVSTEIQKSFLDICERLDQQPKRIAHRDYHSRNLMIKLDEMSVIDFQDARLGPIQYDLVSLLKDSYVDLSQEMSDILLQDYLDKMQERTKTKYSRDEFNTIYELQSVQRCFKACGSFASFFHQRDDRRYLKYLSGTLKRVMKSLEFFPEYSNFTQILKDSGALEKKYELL
ncbi:MAG: phosphotransferase [Bdellovibrionota bacterium]